MSNEMLTWLSIVIGVILAVGGFLFAKNVRSKKQVQKVDRDGIGYQAGRDINLDKKP